MTSRTRKIFALSTALLLACPLLAFFLIDVENFRGLIENRLEKTLGRDVRLGPMELSVWPVFGVLLEDVALAAFEEEGGGELVTAESLRVGAKLGPLLSGRLEVTSILIEQPSLRLERDRDGIWNMQRLLAPRPSGTGAGPDGAEDTASGETLTIETLRVSGGRIAFSDASLAEPPLELQFDDLELELRGFGSESMSFSATTRIEESARLESEGTFRSAEDLDFSLRLADAPPVLVHRFAAIGGLKTQDALGDRAWGFATRVRVAKDSTTLSETFVDGVDLQLIRRGGNWNLTSTPTSSAPSSAEQSVLILAGVDVRQARLLLRDEDADPPIEIRTDALDLRIGEITEGEPRNLTAEGSLRVLQGELDLPFEALRLELDRLPDARQAAQLVATASLQQSAANLDIRGKIGPIPPQGDPEADLQIRAAGWPLERLQPLLPTFTAGTADLDGRLSGRVPGRFDLRGTLAFRQARLTDSELSPLDLGTQFDIDIQEAGDRIVLRRIDADLGSRLNGIRGNLERRNEDWRVDLTLPPTELSVDGFMALIALTGTDPGVTLTADTAETETPLRAEARIVGLVGESSTPQVTGKMAVQGLTADFGLREPLREIEAVVVFDGERIRSERLNTRFGRTDLSGKIEVLLAETPRLTVDLSSQEADFAELLRLSESKEVASNEENPSGQSQEAFRAEGRLRVAKGTWDTLDFQELDARFRLAEGSLNLAPVTMKLYGGTFRGELGSRLDTEPAAFDLDGRVESIDLEAFLADNLDAAGTVRGKFTGELSTTGLSDDAPGALVRSLKGGGTMEIADGGIPKLDLLTTISRISGVLGQYTVAELTDELAREGTRFERLDAGFELADGGLGLGELNLVSPLFSLAGKGRVDLLAGRLDIQAEMAFGQKISTWMREENSRAAELFWDSRRQRVVLPLVLAGPFEAPRGTVDWESAARGVVVRSAEKKLTELLSDVLGKKNPPSASEEEPQKTPTGQDPASTDPTQSQEPAPSRQPPSTATDGDLTITIDRTRWHGSGLAQDLRVEGTARGSDLRRATLTVTDAARRELERTDVTTLREQIFAGADARERALDWSVDIEGTRLLRAQFPLSVRIVLESHSGKMLPIERKVASATRIP